MKIFIHTHGNPPREFDAKTISTNDNSDIIVDSTDDVRHVISIKEFIAITSTPEIL